MSSEVPGGGTEGTTPGAAGTSPARRRPTEGTLWTGPVPGIPPVEGGDLWSAADEQPRRGRRPRASRGDARGLGAGPAPTSGPATPDRATPDRSTRDRPTPGRRPGPSTQGTSPRDPAAEPATDPADPATPWVEPPFDADGVLPEPARPPAPDGVPVGELVDLTPPAQVAREALNRAKAAARARGYRPGQEPRRRPLDPPRGSAGKDARDPQTVGDTLARLLRDRGWVQDVSVGGVIGRWREVVGDQIADHCEPETFQDGVLTVRTDSTAWATQVRLLVPRLLRRLADDVGDDVVREVRVVGPSGPGFGRGPRSVPGRGPRDTWG